MSSISQGLSDLLQKQFNLTERNTTVGREARGAVATFLTMAYILFANPAILSGAGVPQGAATAATALAAGICCLAMGLFANFPMALASGMGLNAFVAYQVVAVAGSWQTAMGLVVIDGLLVALLVILGLREAVMRAIPRDLKLAIGAGIGLFIAFIGLVNAKLVVVPPDTLAVLSQFPGAAMPPVAWGGLESPDAITGLFGILLTAALIVKRVPGAIIIGILASTVLHAFLSGASPEMTWSRPDLSLVFQADILGALKLAFVPLIVALVLVDFFDTIGTVTAIAEQAGIGGKEVRIPRLRNILLVDSLSASLGGLFGVSSVTSYIESAAGVAEGARTGLHSVFVGLLFLLAIFLAPVLAMVPTAATAPALVLVGFLMCANVAEIEFGEWRSAIPAFLTLITIPLTYSISHGIGVGFIAYVLIAALAGRPRDAHPLLWGSAVLFLAYFILG